MLKTDSLTEDLKRAAEMAKKRKKKGRPKVRIRRQLMQKESKMTLSELRKHDTQAYERYVEMLVEDCQDVFVVSGGAQPTISAKTRNGVMRWDPKSTTMCIGSGWEMVRRAPSEEDLG